MEVQVFISIAVIELFDMGRRHLVVDLQLLKYILKRNLILLVLEFPLLVLIEEEIENI